MSIAADIGRGLRTLERALKKPTFNWNGKDYLCVPGIGKSTKALKGGGGFSLDHDLVLRVRTELLPTPGPTTTQKLLYKSVTYRIDEIDSPPGDAYIELRLIDPSKGV
jgi:hypothetical protein